jgi:nucleoid-associated protein YgaU
MSGMATGRRGRALRPAAPPSADKGQAGRAPVPSEESEEQPALAQVIPHPQALARMKSARQRAVPPGSMIVTGAGTAGSHLTARRPPPVSHPVTPVEARQAARHPGTAVRRQAPAPRAVAPRGASIARPQRMPGTGPAAVPAARDGRLQQVLPASTVAAPGTRRAEPRMPRPAARRARLTRRGRLVVTCFMLAGVILVAALAWLALAGPAQAAGPGARPGSVYKNLTTVVVRPGQTLWSIAVRTAPGADPRVVVREIADLNTLSSTVVEPGQQLLVPRNK